MTGKVEGTAILDGLIEGSLPNLPDAEKQLKKWVASTALANLHFDLEFDGGSFSILADTKQVVVDDAGRPLVDKITDAFEKLLDIFPSKDRGHVFSTLRSMEYRKGEEVQVLYVVGPDGLVQTRERVVDAQTTSPLQRLSLKEKVRLGVMGLVVALLIFLASTAFVDYREIFGNIRDSLMPFDTNKLKVDAKVFGNYFTIEKKSVASGHKAVIFTIKRGKEFPLADSDYRRLLEKAGQSLSSRLAIEAIARGYVRCECFNDKNEFIGFTYHRIVGLRNKEAIEIAVPLPADRRLSRVVIAY
ncbi:MAG: hypothetical protein K8S55_10180 [Phycisphaerae bacterium]|nr:hypothetical protein [Phycisphaerae bacterium]